MLRLNDECEYHRPTDGKPLRGVVVRCRAANKYDITTGGQLVQFVEFGNAPGQCCPPGWEPTQPYVTLGAGSLSGEVVANVSGGGAGRPKRWRPPTWPMWLALGLSVGNATAWIWSNLLEKL